MRRDGIDFFLNALGILFRMQRIYPRGSQQVSQAARLAAQRLADWAKPVRITLLGNDTIVQDRRIEELPASFQSLFQSLRQSGWESIEIRPEADEKDLERWMKHVVSKERSPYRSPKIVAGSLNLEPPSRSAPLLAHAVAGYLEFFSHTREALFELEARKPEGLVRAREIVCAIAARIAVGREIFEPIYELKDFDDYTFTHALNVCVLSSALARTVGIAQEMVDAVSLAALCHDVGKRYIPKEILNKQGSLEAEERSLIETHSAQGAKHLLGIPDVESEYPLLPVVAYEHHMGADRSGYPKVPTGLSSLGLHPASLLVAIADVYDALRTVRPYRPALSVARASTILIRDAISGKLHKGYVSAFLVPLNVLGPGRRVVLSDGKRGVIVETKKDRPLNPMVRTEEGRVYDLSDPLKPSIWEVEDEPT